MTESDDGEAKPRPLAFLARTVYVCDVVASCATTADVEAVFPVLPSDEFQVYSEMAFPPVAGAVQVTVSLPVVTPVVAVVTPGLAGAAGTVVIGTAGDDAADADDVQEAFVAVTVAVTEVFEATPPTTIGEDEPVPVCPLLNVTV